MNILHILGNQKLPRNPDTEGAGGPARAALEIARAQVELGHSVTIAVADREPWETHWQGVCLRGLKLASWAVIRFGGRVLDFQRHVPYMLLTYRQPFDIVQGHVYSYMRFLRARGRVVHFHGDPTHRGSKNEGLHLKEADFLNITRYSHAQVAVSQFVADELRNNFGHAVQSQQGYQVHVVYNGVDTEHFHPQRWRDVGGELRRKHHIPDEAVAFLFAGAIVQEKGVLHLARAFARLAADNPSVHLMIAGSNALWGSTFAEKSIHETYEQSVMQALEPLQTDGKVHFLGKVASSAMPGVYAASDVLVLPSICREAFPLVALEALSSGCPVICTNRGGTIEAVNEHTGIGVPPADEEQLVAAMRTLAGQPEIRAQYDTAARQRALEFSWHAAAQQLDMLYQKIAPK